MSAAQSCVGFGLFSLVFDHLGGGAAQAASLAMTQHQVRSFAAVKIRNRCEVDDQAAIEVPLGTGGHISMATASHTPLVCSDFFRYIPRLQLACSIFISSRLNDLLCSFAVVNPRQDDFSQGARQSYPVPGSMAEALDQFISPVAALLTPAAMGMRPLLSPCAGQGACVRRSLPGMRHLKPAASIKRR